MSGRRPVASAAPAALFAVPDAGRADTGPSDTGPSGLGPSDTGPSDTGPSDTGPSGLGPSHTGLNPDAPLDAALPGPAPRCASAERAAARPTAAASTAARAGLLAVLLAACDGAPAGAPVDGFVDGPPAPFTHDAGMAGDYCFPETMGVGLALFDADDDGRLDAYFVQGGPVPGSTDRRPRPTNALLLGDGAGGFVDASARAGDAAHPGFGMGVAVADVNGDGFEDLFVTNVGPDALLLADPVDPVRFADATPPALADPRWNTACGFADLDRDGHLDLAVVGYVAWSYATRPNCAGGPVRDYCSVELYAPIADRLWKGDGRGGFVEISAPWGFGRVPGRGLGLALVDLDADGLTDAYVANDTDANRLYLNQGGRAFRDATDVSGASASADGAHEAGMGIAVGDLDHDGRPDLVVTNFAAEPNSVYVNLGQGRFRERSRMVGVAAPSMGRLAFGVNLLDADGDGAEDLYWACGHVLRNVDASGTTFTWKQPDQLLLAGPDGRFALHPGGPALDTPRVGRGSAVGDLDGDGRPDLVVTNSNASPTIALNRLAPADPARSPLVVELSTDRGSNSFAVGAELVLEVEGEPAQRRWIRSGTSYASQDHLAAYFSVPAGRSPRLTVRWPDGATSEHPLTAPRTRLRQP